MFTRLKVEAIPVRLPRQLKGLDGLVIPGGESTSIGKLMTDYHLVQPVKNMALSGKAILGTCAGMILLAKEISDAGGVIPLGLMDIKVRRNAFGRQAESFETDLNMPALGDKPFHAVFIRAPLIEQVYGEAETLASLGDGTVVAARQGKLLATSFHPELTSDLRFHQYFIDVISGKETALSARGDIAKSNN
jgi:5'-phosphate synthase pdxT subunit